MPRLNPAPLRPAAALLGVVALGAAPAATAQDLVRVPEDCDWTMWWPANGATEVSTIRESFVFIANSSRCQATDAVLRASDGSEPPVVIALATESTTGSFYRTSPGVWFPLRLGETYTLEFNWTTRFEDDQSLVAARPYTFTTSTEPAEVPNLDNLTIERFEVLPDEGRVVFEGTWPDAPPLYVLGVSLPNWRGETNPGYAAVEPDRPFGGLIPSLDGPDLRLEYTGVRLPRGESCLYVGAVAYSFPEGERLWEQQCVERGCSTVAAAPSIPWVAGALLCLAVRRRSRGRRSEEVRCA